MSAKTRAPEDWISFLLSCMDNTPAKPDWNAIALETGAYKSGKFVAQAYSNLRKKYNPLTKINDGDAAASIPQTPKGAKKRGIAAANLPEDDEGTEQKPKRTRKAKKPKKEEPKMESSDEKSDMIKAEGSDDELNGNDTNKEENDGEQD